MNHLHVKERSITTLGPSETAYENRFISVLQNPVRFPNGSEGTYNTIVTGSGFGAVIVPIVVKDGETFFGIVHQHRYPINQFTLEFPRGGTDDLESAGASIEVTEELGQESVSIDLIGVLHPDTGILSTQVGVWIATMDSSILDTQHLEDITGLKPFWMSETEFLSHVCSGKVTCGITLAAYAMFKAKS